MEEVTYTGLLNLAKEHMLIIDCLVQPGELINNNTILCECFGDSKETDTTIKQVRQSFKTHFMRTPVQDLGFLFQQISEIAVRALSPGINSPSIAIMCVDKLADGMIQLANSQPRGRYVIDKESNTFVLRAVRPNFCEIFSTAFHEIRRYSGSSVSVSRRLLERFSDIAQSCEDQTDLLLLSTESEEVWAGCLKGQLSPHDKKRLTQTFESSRHQLDSRLSSLPQ